MPVLTRYKMIVTHQCPARKQGVFNATIVALSALPLADARGTETPVACRGVAKRRCLIAGAQRSIPGVIVAACPKFRSINAPI